MEVYRYKVRTQNIPRKNTFYSNLHLFIINILGDGIWGNLVRAVTNLYLKVIIWGVWQSRQHCPGYLDPCQMPGSSLGSIPKPQSPASTHPGTQQVMTGVVDLCMPHWRARLDQDQGWHTFQEWTCRQKFVFLTLWNI